MYNTIAPRVEWNNQAYDKLCVKAPGFDLPPLAHLALK